MCATVKNAVIQNSFNFVTKMMAAPASAFRQSLTKHFLVEVQCRVVNRCPSLSLFSFFLSFFLSLSLIFAVIIYLFPKLISFPFFPQFFISLSGKCVKIFSGGSTLRASLLQFPHKTWHSVWDTFIKFKPWQVSTSGQYYKHSMVVNYDKRVD